MSGGRFSYKQYHINDIADEIEVVIETNDSNEMNEWGDRKGAHLPPDIIERFQDAVHALRQAAKMAHRIDWLLSGDDGEESFRARWAEDMGNA